MVDFIILALVAGIMGLTLYRYYKRKKSGGGCDCSGGGSNSSCKDYCDCGSEKK